MVTFDDAEIKNLIKHKRTCDGVGWLTFAVLFFSALIAAILSKGAYENYLGVEWNLYLAAFIIAIIFLVGFVFLQIFVISRARNRVNEAVAKRIAKGFYANEDILKGCGNIEFSVTYDGGELTVARQNFSRQISVSAAKLNGGKITDGTLGYITFDLTEIKKLPSLFGAFGSRIWAFIQAYYAVNGGFDSVEITDNTGKNPVAIAVGKDGKLCENTDKNYFIKRGIVK